MEDGAPPATWDEYLRNLDRPGRWADDLTFRALTRRLNCRILLLVGDVKAPQQIIAYGKKIDFKDDRKQVVVPVLYKDRHYQLVAPKTGRTLPAEWLEQEVGGHTQQVPRGGGWLPSRSSSQASDSVCEEGAWLPSRASSSSAAPSLREAGDWMPARASSASSRSASAPSRAKPAEGSARRASANRAANAWLPSRASGSSKASTKGCKRKASSMCGTGANTAKTARSCTSTQRRDAGANSPEPDLTPASEAPGWFCKICNKFVYPTAKRNLARSKNDHIAKHHASVPRSTFERLRGQVLVQTQPAHVLPRPYWKCAWCQEGLPKLETAVYASSIKRHLRRCPKAPKQATPGANVIQLAKALRVPQLARFLKDKVHDPCRALSHLAKSVKVWEQVLCQRARLQKLGHDVRVLLRAEKDEPEPRFFFTCSRCFAVKQRLHRMQKWTECCAADGALSTVRRKRLKTTGPKRAKLFMQFDQRSRRRLCAIWNMTAVERRQFQERVRLLVPNQGPANQWIRDVTEDGDVEPHPGPSAGSPSAAGDHATDMPERPFGQWYINLGGCAKLYEMLELLEAQAGRDRPAAICFAETRTSPADQARITCKLQVLGYNSFWSPSVSSARRGATAYWRGGLCMATARHVPCRQVAEWSGDAGHIVTLDYESIRTVGIWRRPDQDRSQFDDQLGQIFAQAAALHFPCVAFGDFNDEPAESALPELDLRLVAPQDADGNFVPSRWDGSRALDYAVTNDHELCLKATFREEKLGDHKILQLSWRAVFSRQPCHVLTPTPRFAKPDGISDQVWRDEIQHFIEEAEVEWTGDVETDWLQLAALLSDSLSHADNMLQGTPLQTQGRCRPKGSLPRTEQVVPTGRTARRHSAEGRLIQKLDKFLGRLLEARRQGEPSPALQARIFKDWPAEIRHGTVESAVEATSELLAATRRTRKSQALKDWRARMAQGGRATTNWLKGGNCALPGSITDTVNEVTTISRTSTEAIGLLRRFWRRVWRRPEPPDLLEHQQRSWRGQAQVPPAWRSRLTAVTAEDCWRCAQRAKHSTAGPDGIFGQELAWMPVAFWELLCDRLHSWQQAGQFPAVWRHCRTVFLPKDAAAKRGGTTDASRMRPISVFCGVYRVIISAWTSHEQTRAWLNEIAPPTFYGGIQDRSTEQAIRQLDEAWDDDSILLSLDFQLCFDFVRPTLALQAFAWHGAPAELMAILEWVWPCQHRWLQFGSEIGDRADLVSTSLPQGCPAAPLALLLTLRLPAEEISRQLGQHAEQVIFIDDRTLVLKTAAQTARAITLWQQAATALGLRENERKRRIVVRSAARQEQLRRLGLETHSSAEVLGTEFGTEENQVATTARVDQLRRMLTRLGHLSVSGHMREVLYRTILVPQMLWGQWWNCCNAKAMAKVTSAVRRALGTVQMGARALWLLLSGHWMDVAFCVQLNNLAAFSRTEAPRHRRGSPLVQGRWFRSVCMFLEEWGLRPQGPGQWHGPQGEVVSLATGNRDAVQRSLHVLREMWRKAQWHQFLEHHRHEAVLLRQGNIPYEEKRFKLARTLFGRVSPEARGVMLAAALSEEGYSRNRAGVSVARGTANGPCCTHCNLCGQPGTPHWLHAVWECSHFAGHRPPRPPDLLTARLGWPLHDEAIGPAQTRVEFMAEVRAGLRASFGHSHNKRRRVEGRPPELALDSEEIA